MNILITGANGLLGSDLTKILSTSHKIFAVVENKSNLNFKVNKNVSIIVKDLSNFVTTDLPPNIDVVFYLAQ